MKNDISDKKCLAKDTYFQTQITPKFKKVLKPYKIHQAN